MRRCIIHFTNEYALSVKHRLGCDIIQSAYKILLDSNKNLHCDYYHHPKRLAASMDVINKPSTQQPTDVIIS